MSTMNRDCIHAMFQELRAQLPPLPALISDGDARQQWLQGMRSMIQSMPTQRQRAAAVILLSNDLITMRYPGMPLATACKWLCEQFGLTFEALDLQDEEQEQAHP